MPTNESFRVLVFSVPDDRQQSTALLQRELGLVHADAAVLARSLPGLIGHELSQDSAVRLAAAFRDLGVTATTIDESEIPDLSHSRRVHHLKCDASGLTVIDADGREEAPSPWSKLDVVSVGSVPADDPPHYHAAPLASMRSRTKLTSGSGESESPEMLICCLVLSDPLRMVCFEHREMNYEYLTDRKSSSSRTNFATVVKDLAHHAPDAWLTPATHTFIDHGLTRHYQFQSTEEFERSTAFQYLVSQHLRSQSQ
ncbi:MAG: hypothetical protein R3C19_01030 [Planctomycetaceae bacterium]